MDYCNANGARLRHSKFLRWSQADQDKALFWFVRDRSRCPDCRIVDGEGGDLVVEEYLCPTCEQLQREGAPENKGFKGMRKRLVTRQSEEIP